MLEKFSNHIEASFSFLKGKKLLLACSGGMDSVVLAHLISELEMDFALAHCNFSLRGKESDGDEMFVIGLAKQMGVPVFVETFDTNRYAKQNQLSTQLAARILRYTWFDEILTNFKYDYLLTAHQLDDDLETFFINLSRGTGLKGLTGIPAINGKIVRPLLNFSREDIKQYVEEHKLNWREDSSNSKADYLRNKIRLEVIPSFKETNASLLKNFQTTQRNLRASEKLVEDYMALVYNLVVSEVEEGYRIDIPKLQDLPHTSELLYELLSDFGFTEWNDVVNLLDAQTGKQLFSKTHRLLKNRDELLLTQIEVIEGEEIIVPQEGIKTPIQLKIEVVKEIEEVANNIIYVSSEILQFPMTLRRWKEGDAFYPFGMKGKKKLSKYFKDEKLSVYDKEKVWVLCSGEQIVWIVNYRMDNRFRVSEDTETIFKITYVD